MKRVIGLMLIALCLPAGTELQAASTGGCESFDFPLATELQWMRADNSEAATSGEKLAAPPAKAIVLKLQPAANVKFPTPLSRPPKGKAEETFGGTLEFEGVPAAGLYQVSLSGPGWVDVVQAGAPLATVAHTGKSDCDGLRKSVRFDLKPGPFSIQLIDAPAATIKITVRKAD